MAIALACTAGACARASAPPPASATPICEVVVVTSADGRSGTAGCATPTALPTAQATEDAKGKDEGRGKGHGRGSD